MIARFTPYLILLLAGTVSFFSLFGDHGLLHLRQLNNELASLKEKNHQLESSVEELKEKIKAFNTQDKPLEKLAREELGLSKEGEVVYLFPGKPTRTSVGRTGANRPIK